MAPPADRTPPTEPATAAMASGQNSDARCEGWIERGEVSGNGGRKLSPHDVPQAISAYGRATLAPWTPRWPGEPPAASATLRPALASSHITMAVPPIRANATVASTEVWLGRPATFSAPPGRWKFGESTSIPTWWNR